VSGSGSLMHPHWTKFLLQSICIARLNIRRATSWELGSGSHPRLSFRNSRLFRLDNSWEPGEWFPSALMLLMPTCGHSVTESRALATDCFTQRQNVLILSGPAHSQPVATARGSVEGSMDFNLPGFGPTPR